MKGDQIGTLTAHPSLQELSLSNWTWFRCPRAVGGHAHAKTPVAGCGLARACSAPGERPSSPFQFGLETRHQWRADQLVRAGPCGPSARDRAIHRDWISSITLESDERLAANAV